MNSGMIIEIKETSEDRLLNTLLVAEFFSKLSLEQQCQIISEIEDLLSKR